MKIPGVANKKHPAKTRSQWCKVATPVQCLTLICLNLDVNPFTANPVKAYTLPYWSNPPFLIFDIRVLWRSVLSARAPECQKLKMVG